MTIAGAIATNVPLSGDVEISASTSVLVVALCWTCFFTEGHDVGILGAILLALATNASWKLTPIELGTVSASLILTGYLANYLAALVRSAETGFTLSFARIGALLRPLLGCYIASLAVDPRWNFYVFAEVAAVAAVATALIQTK